MIFHSVPPARRIRASHHGLPEGNGTRVVSVVYCSVVSRVKVQAIPDGFETANSSRRVRPRRPATALGRMESNLSPSHRETSGEGVTANDSGRRALLTTSRSRISFYKYSDAFEERAAVTFLAFALDR